MEGIPVGGIVCWPGDEVAAQPLLPCDGSPAIAYPLLMALLDGRFGRNQMGMVLLPDLLGLFVRGAGRDDTPGTQQASSFQAHDHNYDTFPSDTDSDMVAKDDLSAWRGDENTQTSSTQPLPGVAGSLLSGYESRPTNLYLHFMISPGDATMGVSASKSASAPAAAPIPVGAVMPWAGGWSDTIPDGWLPCVGDPCPDDAPQLLKLLTSCGSPFGEQGGTPLLPNLGGQFVRGVQMPSDGTGYDPDFANRSPRPGVGSVQDQTILTHTHGYSNFPDGGGHAGSDFWDDNATSTGATAVTAGTEMHPANLSLIHLVKASSSDDDPPLTAGVILMYVGDERRVENLSGWHACDGQQFSTAEWPDLAAVLPAGHYPNTIGQFVRGADSTPPRRDMDQRSRFQLVMVGGKITEVPESGVLSMQQSALQLHSHGAHLATDEGSGTGYGYYAANGWSSATEQTTAFPDPGSGYGKETRPANIALAFIVNEGAEHLQ